jgi:hypothetical protein
MSRPRKPSMRDALRAPLAQIGEPALVERRRRCLLGAERCVDDLHARVVEYLAEHPGASGSAVAVAVRGRKKDVLRIVGTLRSPSGGSRAVPSDYFEEPQSPERDLASAGAGSSERHHQVASHAAHLMAGMTAIFGKPQ